MSQSPAPPKRQSLARPTAWFTLGMVIFGIVAMLSLFSIGILLTPANFGLSLVIAIILLGLLLVVTVGLIRMQRIALASGLLVGYALASIASGGQCTFWSPTVDYGILAGFIIYVVALGGVVVILIATMVADAIRSTRN